jgi:hypothetical protein
MERAPSNHWIGDWVGPTVGLDTLVKWKKSTAPARNWTLVIQPAAWSLYWLTYPSFLTHIHKKSESVTRVPLKRQKYFIYIKPKSPYWNLLDHYKLYHRHGKLESGISGTDFECEGMSNYTELFHWWIWVKVYSKGYKWHFGNFCA